MGDVVKVTRIVLGLLEGLKADERSRVVGTVVALVGDVATIRLGTPTPKPKPAKAPAPKAESGRRPSAPPSPRIRRPATTQTGGVAALASQTIETLRQIGPLPTSGIAKKLGLSPQHSTLRRAIHDLEREKQIRKQGLLWSLV